MNFEGTIMVRARCIKCNDTIESPPNSGKYVSCSCGAIALDSFHIASNGNELYRAIGNPEDFDNYIDGEDNNEKLNEED